jgi:hypothetical protein
MMEELERDEERKRLPGKRYYENYWGHLLMTHLNF